MDHRLRDRLNEQFIQAEMKHKAQEVYLMLEVSLKPTHAKLFLEAPGKTVAEKEAWVEAHPDWTSIQKGWAAAKAAFHFEEEKLELKKSAFMAEYLQAKQEGESIQKYPRSIT